jgi:hypothetical protein
LVLVPDVNFSPDDFYEEEEDEFKWTDKARRFAARMVAAVVALDRALRESNDLTPEPAWASEPAFSLAEELKLRSELLESERRVEEAQKEKEQIQGQLKQAGQLRGLLYEKGEPLEDSIIKALELMGFVASPYKEANSEFDVVFESAEGRLLGEAEGKDSKAISVDKLRQLVMNIHEDLQREEVSAPAKGVLFGNGYRLSHPARRGIQFTEKCITAAKSASTALLTTSDLYAAVQYLPARPDDAYAKRCREAILARVGVLKLPPIPQTGAAITTEAPGVSLA